MIKVKKGERFGKLKIIKETKRIGVIDRRSFLCRCDCGGKKKVQLGHLLSGHTKSCGCLRNGFFYGTHSKSGTPVYIAWHSMKQRCLNKNRQSFKNYGGRGIKVCKSWLKFENFYKDMGDKPKNLTLDRIDNNGNYCPENCRWATKREQLNNKRTNHFLFFNNKNQTISEWSREVHINKDTLRDRLKRGWSVEKTLTARPH